MTTQTEQQYIVHLDIRATAQGASEAVQEALEQVVLGGLGNVTCSVEAVGSGGESFTVPTCRQESGLDPDAAWADRRPRDDSGYRGEFLG